MGTRAAVDADTVSPITSCTKAFSAPALAILVDEGRMRWADPVITHLPEFRPRDTWMTREVNIADLLAHRTGLADTDHFFCDFTRRADQAAAGRPAGLTVPGRRPLQQHGDDPGGRNPGTRLGEI